MALDDKSKTMVQNNFGQESDKNDLKENCLCRNVSELNCCQCHPER